MRPSPSMAVALAALAVSLAGGATAATLITGRQIRDGSVTVRDLAPAVRARLNRPRVVVGPVGPTGTSGQTGAAGTSGAQGSAGASGASGESGSARAWAHVSSTGAIWGSKNITSVTTAPSSDEAPVYCVRVGDSVQVPGSAPFVIADPIPSAYFAWIPFPRGASCASDPQVITVATMKLSGGTWRNSAMPFVVVVP